MAPDKPTSKPKSETDAKGQFAKSKADSHSDGVASADPKVISEKKSGDATFTKDATRKSMPRG